jgi:hypothetical protein
MTDQEELPKKIRLGIGFALLILAAFDVVQGHPSEPSARWQWLSNWGASMANGWGYTAIKAVAGFVFLIWGFISKH